MAGDHDCLVSAECGRGMKLELVYFPAAYYHDTIKPRASLSDMIIRKGRSKMFLGQNSSCGRKSRYRLFLAVIAKHNSGSSLTAGKEAL